MLLLLVLATTVPATLVVVIVLFALSRHLKSLSSAVSRFRDDVQPLADTLRAGVGDASAKMAALPDKVPAKGAGDRLRS